MQWCRPRWYVSLVLALTSKEQILALAWAFIVEALALVLILRFVALTTSLV